MDNTLQNQGEMKELNYEASSGSIEGAAPTMEQVCLSKDRDTVLSIIVLLLSCLGLAALAHVVV
jgi:hypothetical protein